MRIDPALLMHEGERKRIHRALELLGWHISAGATLVWQDDKFHLFRPSGDGIACGETLWGLVANLNGEKL